MDIRFEQSTIAGLAVSGALAVLLTVAFLIVWKVKTKAPIFPIIVGAVTFVLSAQVLKAIILTPVLATDNAVSRAFNSSKFIYYLIAGLAAGIFEETGRYIAFRYVLKKYHDRRTALDYGVGHGGIEALMLSLTNCITYAVMGVMINNGMLTQLIAGMSDDQKAAALEQLSGIASNSFGACMLWVPERISAVLLHIGLSVLIFRAVRDRKFLLYPLAVVLHAVIDFCCIFYADHPVLTEIMILVYAAIIIVSAIRSVYRKMPATAENTRKTERVTA